MLQTKQGGGRTAVSWKTLALSGLAAFSIRGMQGIGQPCTSMCLGGCEGNASMKAEKEGYQKEGYQAEATRREACGFLC